MEERFVIIDTSSILFGIANRKDVFDIARARLPGYQMIVSRGVIREIRGISQNRGRRGASAGAALEAIKYKKVHVDNNSTDVDDWILSKAIGYPGSVVITNDTALAKRLRSNSVETRKLTRDGSLR